MTRVLCCTLIMILVCGCGQKPPPPTQSPAAEAPPVPLPGAGPPDPPAPELDEPSGVKLPRSTSALAPGHAEDVLFLNVTKSESILNVTKSGSIWLHPADRFGDTDSIDNVAQIEVYIKRRVAEDRRRIRATGGAGKPDDEPDQDLGLTDHDSPEMSAEALRSVVVFRADALTPFVKMYPIMRACRNAGCGQLHLRAIRASDSTEGTIALLLPRSPDESRPGFPDLGEKAKQYSVRVKATDDGNIADITVKGAESLGRDVQGSYKKRLTSTAATEKKRIATEAAKGTKIPPPILIIEIDDNLHHGSVVQLLDVAGQAGFTKVFAVPSDPKKW